MRRGQGALLLLPSVAKAVARTKISFASIGTTLIGQSGKKE